jgi:hypothetical protein
MKKWTIRQGSYRVGPDFSSLRDAVAWLVEHILPNQTIDATLYCGRKIHAVYHAK